ncbi:helix-turn-helix domain-containing protein [Microbacterium sp. YJN-G]|uniref:helix-turn-helix domain-containing protein n=1 Tax=Microbacterium sp. YJN-G TaxID=2763257 RepID=UPI001D0C9184|nr:helix-turn-helix transcriptional regulator [Microbacterium sp. YJN-G]
MFTDLPIQRVTSVLRFSAREAGMSQEKLAAKVGMSQSAVGRRLSGDTPLTLADLDAIATACGMRVSISFAEIETLAAAS